MVPRCNYVKVKKYKTDVESFTPHWLCGQYLGPSTDVRGGHVVLKPSGTFLTTTHVRVTTDPPPLHQIAPTVIVEPDCSEEPPLPPPLSEPPPGAGVGPIELDELPPPRVRARKKGPAVRYVQPFFPEYVSIDEVYQETMSTATSDPELRGLRADVTYELELMAVKFLEDGEPTLQGCAALLEKIGLDCGNLKVPRAKDGCGLLLGAYVHGGTFGVTSLGKELKWTTYYLNKFLARRLRETMANSDNEANFTWTTIALQHASEVPLHRDVHNQRDSRNFVMEIKCDDHAGLWVQDDQDECGVQGGVQAVDHQWQAEDGTVYEGCLVNIKNNPAAFNPRLRHGYLRDSGARWFLSAYTPHGVHRLSEADKMYLESCGFPFPPPREAACSTVLETRPMLKATFFPQSINELDGVHSLHYDVEDDVAACEDDDETCGDWGIYVEEEGVEQGQCGVRNYVTLRVQGKSVIFCGGPHKRLWSPPPMPLTRRI